MNTVLTVSTTALAVDDTNFVKFIPTILYKAIDKVIKEKNKQIKALEKEKKALEENQSPDEKERLYLSTDGKSSNAGQNPPQE